jgi:hypothetical protein
MRVAFKETKIQIWTGAVVEECQDWAFPPNALALWTF